MRDRRDARSEPRHYVRPAVVHLARPDSSWLDAFVREAEAIEGVLGRELMAVEHVGSTSVPGLVAKPITDILVTVRDWTDLDLLVERFATLAYVYTPHSETDDPSRRVFRKGGAASARPLHHVHVTSPNAEYARRTLAFRDYLRLHPATAAEYGELNDGCPSSSKPTPNAGHIPVLPSVQPCRPYYPSAAISRPR